MGRYFIIIFLFAVSGNAVSQGFDIIHPSHPFNRVRSMVKWSGDTVFAAGHNFSLMRSDDAGKTWKSLFGENRHLLDLIRAGSDAKFIYLLPVSTHTFMDSQKDYMDWPSMYLFRYNPYKNDTDRVTIRLGTSTTEHGQKFIDMSVTPDAIYVYGYGYGTGSMYELHCSTDQGTTWVERNLPRTDVPTFSQSIHFLSAGTGIIAKTISQNKYLFLTEDSCKTWKEVFGPYLPDSDDRQPVEWVDDSTIVIGVNGRMYTSVNRGASWQQSAPIPWRGQPKISSIAFAPRGIGYIASRDRELFRSTDWGGSWANVNQQIFDGANNDCMVSDSVFLLSCGYGAFIRTEDLGMTYDFVHYSASGGNIQFFNKTTGYKRSYPWYLKSEDGGRSWQEYSKPRPPVDVFIHPVPSIAYEVSGTGKGLKIFLSEDSAKTWQPVYQHPGTDSTITILKRTSYRGSDTVFFLSSNDNILYTKDRGQSFGVLSNLTRTAKEKIEFIDFSKPDHQWILRANSSTDSASLMHSTNDGATWDQVWSSDSIWQVTGMKALGRGEKLVLIIDRLSFTVSSNLIAKTTDAGKSWTAIKPDIVPSGKIDYVSWTRSIGLDSRGTLWSTDNDWQTFSRAYSYSAADNGGFWSWPPCFLDENTGWLGGGNGAVLFTDHGGLNWTPEPPAVVKDIFLDQTYPNPVSSAAQATLRISGDRAMSVAIEIFDALGRRLKAIASRRMEPGSHTISFDASSFTPGVYFIRMRSEQGMDVRKMVVAR